MPSVAIDLGCRTARGRVLGAPACVELPSDGGRDGASPLSRGVVADVDGATRLVERLLRRARRLPLGRWRGVVCVPGSASPTERAALLAAVRGAGVRVLAVVPETLAAALGSGLDVGSDWAQLVVDVGHGLTDAGVIRAGRVIAVAPPGPGCGDVQRSIARAIERRCRIRLPEQTLDALCRDLTRLRLEPHAALTLQGRGYDGSVRLATAPAAVVTAAADREIARIAAHVGRFVRHLGAEVGCEVIEGDLLLSGGGALLDGLAERLAGATGIAVRVAPEPLPAVLRGASDVLATLCTLGRSVFGRFALDRDLG